MARIPRKPAASERNRKTLERIRKKEIEPLPPTGGGGGGGLPYISRAGIPESGSSLDHDSAGTVFYPSWQDNTFDHISGPEFTVETWTTYGGGAYKSLSGAETSNATPSDRPSLIEITNPGVYFAAIQMQFNLYWSGISPDVAEYDLTLFVDALEAGSGSVDVAIRHPLSIYYTGNAYTISGSTPFVVTTGGSFTYFGLSVRAWNAARTSSASADHVLAAARTRVLVVRLGDAT